METRKRTFLGQLSIVLLVIVVGVPAGYLLIIGTWGTILVPFVVAFYAAPLFLLHYVVWGRAFSKRLHDEAGGCVQSPDRLPDAAPDTD